MQPCGKRYACLGPVLWHTLIGVLVCAVRSKLLMLVVPFLKRWNYTRVLEQV